MTLPNFEAEPPSGGLFEELSAAADSASTGIPESIPDTPKAGDSLGERLRRAGRSKVNTAPKARATKTATPKEPPSKAGEFVEPLTSIYSAIGVAVTFRDHDGICGETIVGNAEKCAIAWDELAQKDANVRRALRTLTKGSAWGSVIAAHGVIAMAIASAHGPGNFVRYTPPPEDEPEPPIDIRSRIPDEARRTRRAEPMTEPVDIEWSPNG